MIRRRRVQVGETHVDRYIEFPLPGWRHHARRMFASGKPNGWEIAWNYAVLSRYGAEGVTFRYAGDRVNLKVVLKRDPGSCQDV